MAAATPEKRIPKYRRHKGTGQAFVELNGRRIYLGRHDLAESRQKYHRAIAEWEAAGRQLPVKAEAFTVVELIARFWRHAKNYYKLPDGRQSTELDNYRQALRPLKQIYGPTLVADFGPRALKAVRQQMIDRGWARTHINKQVSRIKTVFRWGTEEELVPPSVYHGLLAVGGLKMGRCAARETEPVKPVPDAHVDAVEPFVSRQVWAMIQVQLLTGARPGEVVVLTSGGFDTSGKVWVYDFGHHKTRHHGHERRLYFGPRAQAVIQPYMRPDLSAFLFSPAEAEQERRLRLHACRETSLSCGNRPGTNRRRRPVHQPGERYDVDTFRRAIERACDQAFPLPEQLARLRVPAAGRKKSASRWETHAEWKARIGDKAWEQVLAWRAAHRWHPNQLRHSAASALRREFGIDVAQTVLGHRMGSRITEIYAEASVQRAMAALGAIG